MLNGSADLGACTVMPATSSAHPLPAAAPIPWNCRCVLAAPKEPQEVAAYCSFRSGVRLKSGLMESCDLKASFVFWSKFLANPDNNASVREANIVRE